MHGYLEELTTNAESLSKEIVDGKPESFQWEMHLFCSRHLTVGISWKRPNPFPQLSNKQVTTVKTQLICPCTKSAQSTQLLLPSTSNHHSILTHEDDVTVHSRIQTMSHSHLSTRMTLSPTIQCLQELPLVLAFQRTRRLVQRQNRGIAQNRTRQCQYSSPKITTQMSAQ